MKFSEYVEGAFLLTEQDTDTYLESVNQMFELEKENALFFSESSEEIDECNPMSDFFEEYSDYFEDGDEKPRKNIFKNAIGAVAKALKFIKEQIKKFVEMIKAKVSSFIRNVKYRKQIQAIKKALQGSSAKIKTKDIKKYVNLMDKFYRKNKEVLTKMITQFKARALTADNLEKMTKIVDALDKKMDEEVKKLSDAKIDMLVTKAVDEFNSTLESIVDDPIFKDFEKTLDNMEKEVSNMEVEESPFQEASSDLAEPQKVCSTMKAISSTIKKNKSDFVTFTMSGLGQIIKSTSKMSCTFFPGPGMGILSGINMVSSARKEYKESIKKDYERLKNAEKERIEKEKHEELLKGNNIKTIFEE